MQMMERDLFAGWRSCVALLLALALCACGSGSGSGSGGGGTATPPPAVHCVTGDQASSSDQCGQLLLSLTDIAGDLLRYRIDVLSLSLERSDGEVVQLLPGRTSVDFAQYTELNELLASATVPVGTYVSGQITFDYSDADVRVEVDGVAEPALLVDTDGVAVEQVTVELELDPFNRLVIAPQVAATMEFDVNLAASNIVDIAPLPPLVALQAVVTAEVNPARQRESRLRGPLISVDEDAGSYRIAVRPFNRTSGRFGGVDIFSAAQTAWEIDGAPYLGAAGLSALAEEPTDTATVAFGSYDRLRRRFIAREVFAGSSVPGDTLDALQGHVLARTGNIITILGGRLLRTDGSETYEDLMTLLVDNTTLVRNPRFPFERKDISSISVGQRITALGRWDSELMDARAGFVRLRATGLDATLNGGGDGELNVTALAFGGRDAALFDFAGTGADASLDADPDFYQVNSGELDTPAIAVGEPLHVRGFVTPFGSAPPDFDADSLVDFAAGGAQLQVSWAGRGSIDAFVSLGADGLRLNLIEELLGPAHTIRRGGIRTDLLALQIQPQLIPAAERGLYALVRAGVVTLYSDFGLFADDLDRRIRFGARVKRLHADGGYRTGASSMEVVRVAVVLD